MNLCDYYFWGYNHESADVRFLTNVIHCHCSAKAKKMRGLYNLVQLGYEVRSGNTLFDVRIGGEQHGISELEEYA